jgi:hypothetical protein
MRRSVDLDEQLEADLSLAVGATGKQPALLLQQALRVGLLSVVNNGGERPEGYFKDAYGADEERVALEAAMASVAQTPER